MKHDSEKKISFLVIKTAGIVLITVLLSLSCQVNMNDDNVGRKNKFVFDNEAEYAGSDNFSINPGQGFSQESKAGTMACLVSKNRNLAG